MTLTTGSFFNPEAISVADTPLTVPEYKTVTDPLAEISKAEMSSRKLVALRLPVERREVSWLTACSKESAMESPPR
ncbi:MAG: hypothetical protein IPI21_16435 [Propionivibrio sp.]|nr:hypothetical protein [Propionivibrio sp.]